MEEPEAHTALTVEARPSAALNYRDLSSLYPLAARQPHSRGGDAHNNQRAPAGEMHGRRRRADIVALERDAYRASDGSPRASRPPSSPPPSSTKGATPSSVAPARAFNGSHSRRSARGSSLGSACPSDFSTPPTSGKHASRRAPT